MATSRGRPRARRSTIGGKTDILIRVDGKNIFIAE